jgi:transposase
MEPMYYIGLDVHKRTICYCVKDSRGAIHSEGSLSATRFDLDVWMKTLPQPWSAAMEATMFTGWIYDHLKPHAAVLKVAHPLMLRAIAAAKKKNDRIDAGLVIASLRKRGTGQEGFLRRVACQVLPLIRLGQGA